MARGRFRRRSSYGNQLKALPIEAMYAAGVSLASLIMFAGIIVAAVYFAGETPRWIGGLGTIGFLVSLCAFIFNIGQMKTKTEFKYRIICFVISSVAMIVWAAALVIGLVRG
ncbi:MAG: hypothetical protein E7273_08990 [Pseudobutyrivibrio ruminis]|nr:hypothetical protein [Pseudobutyrivibrio ruminis]